MFLSYRYQRNGGEWEDVDEAVALETTPCNYGGHRYWFRCPAVGCGRRVAILYGGGIFACRHCYRLAYTSQREAAHYWAMRRAQTIRMKLGGTESFGEWFPEKPKGMHWHTYERLYAKATAAELRSWEGIADKMQLWRATIG